jgi:hypothetical protein
MKKIGLEKLFKISNIFEFLTSICLSSFLLQKIYLLRLITIILRRIKSKIIRIIIINL